MMRKLLSILLSVSMVLAPMQGAWAVDYHACSCDTGTVQMGDGTLEGASGDCAVGSSGANGLSPATPRLTHTITQVNAAAPGDRFLFCEGGKWNNFSLASPWRDNLFSTHGANPVTVGSYAPPSGATGQPILHLTSGAMFTIGDYSSCNAPRGGYVIRDLHLHGSSTTGESAVGNYAIVGIGEIRNVQILNNRITGWRDAVQISALSKYDQCNATHPGVYRQFQSNVSFITIAGNTIDYNFSHGMLAAGSDALVERNLYYRNNRGGSNGVHAIYWAGAAANYANERVTFRRNIFRFNSRVDPGFSDATRNGNAPDDGRTCRAGNLTMRQMVDANIEDNFLENDLANSTCYGLNANTGYSHAEFHTNVRFARNTVVNPGGTAINFQGALNTVVENNKVVMLQSGQISLQGAITTLSSSEVPESPNSVTIRNNTLWLWGGLAIDARSQGTPANQVVTGNLIHFWGNGTPRTAFNHDARSTYAAFNWNLVSNATQFSSTYTTLGTEQANCPSGTASFDCNGLRADPLFITTPSAGNNYNVKTSGTSPVLGAANNSYCARLNAEGKVRGTICNIGAY